MSNLKGLKKKKNTILNENKINVHLPSKL